MKISRRKANLLGLAATTLITIPGFIGCVYGPSSSYPANSGPVSANAPQAAAGAVSANAPQTNPAEKKNTFALAATINENSNIDIELLGEVGLSNDGDDTDEQTGTGGSVEAIPNSTYDGGVTAYAFRYPKDGDKIYWTQVYVKSDAYDLLGIHVGDDITVIKEVMEKYGYTFSESTDRVYTSEDVDHEEIYKNGDVYFGFYMKGDTLVYMLVSVHEESADDGVVY